jgi:filamentous hemagglutinin
MNKLRYRIIFNKTRGQYMAVQETARTDSKSTGQSRAANVPVPALGGIQSALRQMTSTIAAAFGLFSMACGVASAQVIADPSAPGHQRATILSTANGVLQVNVQTPSAAGVSRNTYIQFDVPKSGAILNNSRVNVQTQIGGWVQANPWMAEGSARVILNEVNSSKASELRGFIEVAGPRAETIIANPAGIVVDGGGFINVSRATLTTGTPIMNNGVLDGYAVQRGQISVQGAGLDASQTDYTGLIARSIVVNAGLWANQLAITTGANQVSVGNSAITARSAVGDTPSYGLDVSQLGGMYANKIILVGTEAGVGVRNAGNLGTAGDMVVTTEGRLENRGSMQAQAAMQIKAESLQNSGQITGGTEALLSLHNDVDNSLGTIQAPRIELSAATGGINNAQGKIVQTGSGGLDVSALTFANTQGGLLGTPEPLPGTGNASDAGSSTGTGESTGNTSGSPGADNGNTSAGNGSSTAPSGPSSPTTSATPPVSTTNGIVRAAAVIDNSAGIITAAGGTNLSVGGLDNSGGKLTLDSLSVDGQAFSNRLGTVTVRHGFNARATSFANTGGTVLVGDGFAAQMDQFDNANGLLQADHWQITVGQGMDNTHGTLRFTGNQTGLLSVGSELNNESGALEAASDLQLTAGSITGSGGKLNTLGDLKLNSGATSARTATWTIGGNAELHTAELENSGIISAGKDLNISSAALNNSDGKLSAGANIVINAGGALDNTHGYIQAGKDLLLSTAGALNNSGGVLESVGAVSTMTIQAQAIDNNAGRISNAGTGLTHVSSNNSIDNNGLIAGNGNVSVSAQVLNNRTAGMIVAAGNLDLGVHAQLDNAGLINSGGTLDFRETTAIFKNSGQTVAGATATISVAAINNDGGQIATAAGSNGDVQLSAQSLSNNAGAISADRHAVLAIGGDVINNAGLIRSVGNMDLQANGALVNNKGTIEATGSASGMLVKAGNIDNTAGRIVNVGAGGSSVSAQNSLVNSGLIAGNGTLAISAQTVRNDGAGVIASGKDMELAARQQLDNAGTISSAAALNFRQSAAVLNNSGNIVTAGNITLAAARINNDGGKIATVKDTLADMVLSAQNLSNQGGAIIIDRNVTLTIGGAVDNRGGVLQAGKNLQLAASGALDNSAGSIETLDAGSTLDVHALAIQNNAGRIVNVGTGASNIRSDSSIDNSGLIAGNGGLDVQANTLQNNAGGTVSAGGSLELGITQQLNNRATISSGGTLRMSQAGAALDNSGQIVSGGDTTIAVGTIKNDGGLIATVKNFGAGILLSGSSLSNRNGSILSDSDATLNMSSAVDNSAGQIQANGDLQLSAGGILTNNAGAIEAIAASSTLNVQGQSIANNAGRIANVGSGAMSVSSNSSVTSSGTIAGNGNLVLAAQTVQNQAGGTIGAGGNLSLAVQQQFVNQGAVNSAATLTFNQAGASFSNSGKIAANGQLSITASSLNNDGGQISTAKGFGASIALNGQSLSNRSGQVLADGDATVTVGGAVDNSQGTLQAGKDMKLTASATLQNNGGIIEALGAFSTLTLQAQAISNGSGRISNVGSGATTVTSQSDLSTAGTIAGSGALRLNAQTLQNLAGGTIASGNNLDLVITQQLSNQGKINAAGTLSFNQTSANFTNSGQILSGGTATIAANIVNNDGGQLGTSQGSAADLALTSQTLSNQGGHIVADRDLTVTTHAMQGTGELFGGRDLSLTMDGDYTQGGGTQQFHSNRDLSLTVTGNITNTTTFEAVRNLTLNGNTITNQAGAVIRAQGVALKASGNLSNAGEINGEDTVTLTAANIDNSNAIVGGNLTLTTQNLNNTSAQALLGSTGNMALWVANQLNNTGGATIYSAGSVSIGANPAGASAAVVNNNSSTIEAAGNLSLAAATLNNIRDNITLVKVTTVDETRHMTLPSWLSYGDNHNFYDPSSGNYLPHEVYFVNPQDVLENTTYVTPDGYMIGRAVIRTHANDSAFFIASAGLYSSYGHRERMQMSDGTRVLYYTSATSNLVNPDQGGSPDVTWPWYGAGTNWDAPAPTFSNQYGSCTTNCIRLTTQPDYNDPTSTIIRDMTLMLAPVREKLEVSRDVHHTAVEDRLAPGAGNAAQILSGGNMHLTVDQTLNNQYGDIMATGSLAIDGSANISNQGVTLYRTHTFDGTWTTVDSTVAPFSNPSISEAIGSAAGTISGGKGVSISGRSFTNVDVSAGTVGNIRDAVNVIGSGATAAGPSGYGVAGNALNHAVASSGASASSVGTDAQIAGKAGDSGTPGMTMRAQGSARGSSIGLGAQAINAASSGGNTVRISPSGLFVKNPDANGRYLLETRPQFANQGDWISSDYLLKQLGIDPALTQKRLGDGFYEQRLVREQLAELTGRAPVDGASDDSRYQQLLTNAASYAQQWNLRPGISLTPDQVSQLTSDIVWLVSETVSLPDGSTETVLVPKVYLAHLGADAVKLSGALVTGDGVDIRTDDIVNRGGVIDGGNGRTVLVARQDIVNQGGNISGGAVALAAGRDVRNETLIVKETFAAPQASSSFTSLSNQAAITAGGALEIVAGRDLSIAGSQVSASKDMLLTADRNLTIDTVQTGRTLDVVASGYARESEVTHVGSQVQAGGNLIVAAGRKQDGDLTVTGSALSAGKDLTAMGTNVRIASAIDSSDVDMFAQLKKATVSFQAHTENVVGGTLTAGGKLTVVAKGSIGADDKAITGTGNLVLTGATVTSDKGAVTLAANNDIGILDQLIREDSRFEFHYESRKLFSKKSSTQIDDVKAVQSVGSTISGNTVAIQANNNLTVLGSSVVGSGDVTLTAKDGNVEILASQSTTVESHLKESKKSGLGFSKNGIGVTLGSSQQKSTFDGDYVLQSEARSAVGTTGGNLIITAGRDTLVKGSDLIAGRAQGDIEGKTGHIDIQAQNIRIEPGEDASRTKATADSKSKGLTVALVGTPVDTVRNLNDAKDTPGTYGKVHAVATEAAASMLDVPQVTVSFAKSQSSSRVSTDDLEHTGSSLTAAGDIRLRATGSGAKDMAGKAIDGDLTITGSTLTAGGLAKLDAERNVTLQASTDQYLQDSEAHNKSTNLNLGLPTPGVLVRAISGGPNSGGVGVFPYGKGTAADSAHTEASVQRPSIVTAANVIVNSKDGDIRIAGSGVNATNDINLTATNGQIDIVSGQDRRTHEEDHSSKTVGDLGSNAREGSFGTSASIGVRTEHSTLDTTQALQNNIRSELVAGGNINIDAKRDVTVQGADLRAGRDLTLIGANLYLDPAQDSSHTEQTREVSQAGVNLSLSGYAVEAAKALEQAANAKDDDRLAALYGTKAGLTLYNGLSGGTNPLAPGGSPAIIKATVSIGSSSASSRAEVDAAQQFGSTLSAGQSVTLIATGSGQTDANGNAADGDIRARGTQISGTNVLLSAERDITLESAQDTTHLDSSENSKNASIGIGFGLGGQQNGFTLELAAAKAAGTVKGDSLTQHNTAITASDTLSLTSGRDTTLAGAQVRGERIEATVGGDLNIVSRQDTETYHSQFDSSGFQASICPPPACVGAPVTGSASVAQGEIDSTFAAVKEQSGLYAGQGGFDVTVKGNTELKGAVIASAAEADKNRLTTGTLTVSDLDNKAEFTSSSSGVSLSYGGGSALQTLTSNLAANAAANAIGDQQGSAAGTTRSAISAGTVVITDDAGQQTQTGKSAADSVASLNRDTQNASGAIDKIFDLKTVQKEQETQKVLAEVAQLVAPILYTKVGDALDQQPAEVKVAVHALVGGLMSKALGGEFGTGAAGAAAATLAVETFGKDILNIQGLSTEDKEALVQLMGLVTSQVTATVAGAGASDANAAGATAKLATEYNYLKHQDILDITKARNDCNGGKGSAHACNEEKRLEALNKQRDAELDACRGDTSARCNGVRQEVRTAYAEIIRKSDVFASVDYRLEAGNTEIQADSTISTLDRLKGFQGGLVDSVMSLTKGAIITVKAATGDREAADQVNQTLDGVIRVASTPDLWGKILANASQESRDKLADAYERGDGVALGKIAGEVLSNFIGGGAGTVRKVGSVVEDSAKIVGNVDKVIDTAKGAKGGAVFATEADQAYFWSGLGRGGDKVAAELATTRGGTTLEQITKARGIDLPTWDAANPASVQTWQNASRAYAEGASGNVRAVIGDSLRPGSIWETIELPALKANPNVTRIIQVNPATGVETVIFSRGRL